VQLVVPGSSAALPVAQVRLISPCSVDPAVVGLDGTVAPYTFAVTALRFSFVPSSVNDTASGEPFSCDAFAAVNGEQVVNTGWPGSEGGVPF
jgi:hypothetical protein